MNRIEYSEKYKQIARDEWFKYHKASQYALLDPSAFDWRRPDSGFYHIRYVLHGPCVFVSGDVGEAVYRFGQIIRLEWLADTDFEYFHGKCVASPMGRDFYCWHPKLAEDQFNEITATMKTITPYLRKAIGQVVFYTEDECCRSLEHCREKGMDPMFLSDIMQAGKPPHPQSIAHWVGLKMVHEQLSAKEHAQ